MRHDLRRRLVVALKGVELESDARSEDQSVVGEPRAVLQVNRLCIGIDACCCFVDNFDLGFFSKRPVVVGK